MNPVKWEGLVAAGIAVAVLSSWISMKVINAENQELPERSTLIIAHRGASAAAPENTRASIAAAIRMGAPVIEYDVRVTSDGALLLFHDEELDKLARRKGTFEALNESEATELDVGSWFGPDFSEERPPTLAAAIEQCRAGGSVSLIEHKTGPASAYAATIRELGAEGDVIVQSFDWEFLAAFRKELPEIPIGALGSKEFDVSKKAKIEALSPDWVGWKWSDFSPAEFKWCRDRDFRVALWTVNDPAEAKRWIARGVDGIITDVPDQMLTLLAEP